MEARISGEEALNPDPEPPVRAVAEDAGGQVDAVLAVKVGLDQVPLGEDFGPAEPLVFRAAEVFGALVPLVEARDGVLLAAAADARREALFGEAAERARSGSPPAFQKASAC